MNTNYVIKKSISQLLGQMIEWTCHNSPEDKSCSGLMEPENLMLFRMHVIMMAELHFQNRLCINDVLEVQDYVDKVGREHGHIFGDYSTGSWGVRLSELRKIKDILKIPRDVEMLSHGDEYILGDDPDPLIIKEYKIGTSWIGVKLHQPKFPNNPFEVCLSWQEMPKLYKEYF